MSANGSRKIKPKARHEPQSATSPARSNSAILALTLPLEGESLRALELPQSGSTDISSARAFVESLRTLPPATPDL